MEAYIPKGAVAYNDHSYMVFGSSYSWTEAEAFCKSLGGHLVTITKCFEKADADGFLVYCHHQRES